MYIGDDYWQLSLIFGCRTFGNNGIFKMFLVAICMLPAPICCPSFIAMHSIKLLFAVADFSSLQRFSISQIDQNPFPALYPNNPFVTCCNHTLMGVFMGIIRLI